MQQHGKVLLQGGTSFGTATPGGCMATAELAAQSSSNKPGMLGRGLANTLGFPFIQPSSPQASRLPPCDTLFLY